MSLRVGQGYDAHRLVDGRPLVLGGVIVDTQRGLEGHSDADVLCHAVMDALLGALALGDLGQHFPPGDPAYAGADSLALLLAVRKLIDEAGGRVINVDATILLEAPRLSPHARAMRENLAGALAIPVEAVSVKATTLDGLGFVGREEGAAATAVVLVETK